MTRAQSQPPAADPQYGVPFSHSITLTEEQHHKKSSSSSHKLGTFSGVYVPNTLNLISVLMFLRFGFLLGMGGLFQMLLMLLLTFGIALLSALSLSAIATNGTVRGGGAYYMISRSLGPEFGGSVGVVFFGGQVLNAGLNVVSFVESMLNLFGETHGSIHRFLPESYWYTFGYGTLLLLLCTSICLLGSGLFSRCGNVLYWIMLASIISIPLSALFNPRTASNGGYKYFTGPSISTLRENLWPYIPPKEDHVPKIYRTFQGLFGVFFVVGAGVFGGASMSGDLARPSISIPSGTLWSALTAFVAYGVVIVSLACTVRREGLVRDMGVLEEIAGVWWSVEAGVWASSLFSSLLGVIGSAKLLQAIARDDLLPLMGPLAQGTPSNDEPTIAVLVTYLLIQLTLLADINQIASFITLTFLLTFAVVNLACFLLTLSSAPSWRPRFRWYSAWTAGVGAVVCVGVGVGVDRVWAGVSAGGTGVLWVLILYLGSPKSWGDVSTSLMYHQVRKYLLRLNTKKEHVKYWRPQILLLVNNARNSWNLIQFANHLKKGALYILGHVIVGEFDDCLSELKKEKAAWAKFIEMSRVKAFMQLSVAPSVVWGVRNIVLSAGLGKLAPNIVMMSFVNLTDLRPPTPAPSIASLRNRNVAKGKVRIEVKGQLPTDTFRSEMAIKVQEWVEVVEDVLSLNMNLAISKGFADLDLPMKGRRVEGKKYIDLWPIQMSAEIADDTQVRAQSFDTYTMILQMGTILHTVPAWKKYVLRVIVFVEYAQDVAVERARVQELLDNLRIVAELVVLYLDSGRVQAYEHIVKGRVRPSAEADRLEEMLAHEEWWREIKSKRDAGQAVAVHDSPNARRRSSVSVGAAVTAAASVASATGSMPRRRSSISNLRSLKEGRLSMQIGLPHPDLFNQHGGFSDSSDEDLLSDEEDVDDTWVGGIGHEAMEGSAMLSSSSEDDRAKAQGSVSQSGESFYQTPEASTAALLPSFTNYSPTRTRDRTGRSYNDRSPLEDEDKNGGSRPGTSSTPGPSASPIPPLQLNDVEEGDSNRPTITFVDTPRPLRASPTPMASALEFNDLPSRGQHLIINDLIRTYSSDEASVVFTTLPVPVHGTHEDPERSWRYVEDLEVLCEGIPPVLLMYSTSLTVTMAL
ncbi:hypothetical protein SAICODRAFT_59211 [Saitoella complicata NRRL Y-17804]|nr:uncharacterized protein SAICODRAFT_59211 [Saitoella complicata NRRL Y-17804]ODQ51829.1 hypothetical protein SAICODRAFT_59211 [Saitoella complicata NRRL Y-17804]